MSTHMVLTILTCMYLLAEEDMRGIHAGQADKREVQHLVGLGIYGLLKGL